LKNKASQPGAAGPRTIRVVPRALAPSVIRYRLTGSISADVSDIELGLKPTGAEIMSDARLLVSREGGAHLVRQLMAHFPGAQANSEERLRIFSMLLDEVEAAMLAPNLPNQVSTDAGRSMFRMLRLIAAGITGEARSGQ
jgi:hypothetical protein